MKKNSNGTNQLTDQQEMMRMQVVDLELKARYWRAQYDIRYYTLQAEKLQPEYDKYMEEQAKLAEEQRQKMIEELEKAVADRQQPVDTAQEEV